MKKKLSPEEARQRRKEYLHERYKRLREAMTPEEHQRELEYARANYQANREHKLALQRKRYWANVELNRQKQRDYRQKNREHILARERLYRAQQRAWSLIKKKKPDLQKKRDSYVSYYWRHRDKILARAKARYQRKKEFLKINRLLKKYYKEVEPMARTNRRTFWILYSKSGRFTTQLFDNTIDGRSSLCLCNTRNWIPTYPYSPEEIQEIEKNFIEKNDYKPFIKAYIRKPIEMRLCFITFVTGEDFEGLTQDTDEFGQPIKE